MLEEQLAANACSSVEFDWISGCDTLHSVLRSVYPDTDVILSQHILQSFSHMLKFYRDAFQGTL